MMLVLDVYPSLFRIQIEKYFFLYVHSVDETNLDINRCKTTHNLSVNSSNNDIVDKSCTSNEERNIFISMCS